jgi:pimeloyl-ACP methyl ester carboxylesterase
VAWQTEHKAPMNHSVETESGLVRYTELGAGLVALFVGGALLDESLRGEHTGLSDMRRILAVELLAHVYAGIARELDSAKANAKMLGQFLDALYIDQVDLIGTDGGCDVARVFAATHPERIRSLTLTDWAPSDESPALLRSFLGLMASRHLRDSFDGMLPSKQTCHYHETSKEDYEGAKRVTDETIRANLRLFVSSDHLTRDWEPFITSVYSRYTLAIIALLKELDTPAVLVWATDEGYFGSDWSHSLSRTIPGTVRKVEFIGTRLFLPKDSQEFGRDMRGFLLKVDLGLKTGHADA